MITFKKIISENMLSAKQMKKYCGRMIDEIHKMTGVMGTAINKCSSILFKVSDFDKLKSLNVEFAPYKDYIMLGVNDTTIRKILGDNYAI